MYNLYIHITYKYDTYTRLLWEQAVNRHMILLFKLQQYINDMNYDAFYIPDCPF